MDNDENNFGNDDYGSTPMSVRGDEFDSGATIVKSSKMNDLNDDNDGFNPDLGDVPF